MTLRVIEGFEWFPSGGNATQLFAAAGYYSTFNNGIYSAPTTGRFDYGKTFQYALAPGNLDPNQVIALTDSSDDLNTSGMAVYVDQANSAYVWYTLFDAVTGAPQLSFYFTEYGVIRIYRGYPWTGTLIGTTSAGAYRDNEWFYFEVQSVTHATAGTVKLRINTKVVFDGIDLNTKNTANSFVDSYGFGCFRNGGGNSAFIKFDDFYFCDGQGSINNDFLGNVRVKQQLAIANGPNIDFAIGGTAPAATNWQSVLNAALDDTKYVYSGTPGDYDLYDLDPNLNTPLVLGVQVRAGLRQDDATQRIARLMLNTGGTDYVGSVDHYLNQSYTHYRDLWELNPNTGLAWTGTEVNGMYAGVKVQS